MLLTFSSRGSLPLGKMGERLQVHPTSVTSIVRKLEADGHVVRRAAPRRRPGRARRDHRRRPGRRRGGDRATSWRPTSASARSTTTSCGRSPSCCARSGARPRRLLRLSRALWRRFSRTSYYLTMTSMSDVPRRDARSRWQARYDGARDAGRVRDADFTTLSGHGGRSRRTAPTTPSGPASSRSPAASTRPATAGRTWTIRQFAGFGNAEQTNERYHMILGRGGGGLSVAFDMPTLMGRDSDDPMSLGEVGHCGVAIDSRRRHGERSSTASTWARSPPR